jgi:hypothetical protein
MLSKGGVALPARHPCLANARVEGERIVLRYLTRRDYPWLAELLNEHVRCAGKKRSELEQGLFASERPFVPRAKLAVALYVLEGLTRGAIAAVVPPKQARALVFGAAAGSDCPRAAVLAEVAASLDVSTESLESSLLADLEGERLLMSPPEGFGVERLAVAANLAIVCAHLRRAVRVRIRAAGNTAPLLRHARQSGLICVALQEAAPAPHALALEVSGPFSLFRHTEVYGRALAALLPRLTYCQEYELIAECLLGPDRSTAILQVHSGDPLGHGGGEDEREAPSARRLSALLSRSAPRYRCSFVKEPLEVSGMLLFPDLTVVDEASPRLVWHIELVGFWTPASVSTKAAKLRRSGFWRYILCIDERRRCADGELPDDPNLLLYEGRVRAHVLLDALARCGEAPAGRGVSGCLPDAPAEKRQERAEEADFD